VIECGRSGRRSYVCDPDRVISENNAVILDMAIEYIRANGTCACRRKKCAKLDLMRGPAISVALLSSLSLSDGLNDTLKNKRLTMETFGNALHKKADWKFGNCKDDITIILSKFDQLIYTVVSERLNTKLKPACIDDVLSSVRPLLSAGAIGKALKETIVSYGRILSYLKEDDKLNSTRNDCLKDKSTLDTKPNHWRDLQPKLKWTKDNFPNPQEEPRRCGRRAPSLLCDPNKLLSEHEAKAVDGAQEDIRIHSSTQCTRNETVNCDEGVQVFIAIIPAIERYSMHDTDRADPWDVFISHIRNTSFEGKYACDDTIGILVSTSDQKMRTSIGESLKTTFTGELLTCINTLAEPLVKKDRYSEAILQVLAAYRDVLISSNYSCVVNTMTTASDIFQSQRMNIFTSWYIAAAASLGGLIVLLTIVGICIRYNRQCRTIKETHFSGYVAAKYKSPAAAAKSSASCEQNIEAPVISVCQANNHIEIEEDSRLEGNRAINEVCNEKMSVEAVVSIELRETESNELQNGDIVV
ncbi:unnamed protein product, partial [Owenia fusiformis]